AAGVTTVTNYYSVSGQRVAMRKGAILSYLVPDFLGSDSIALNADGSVQAVQLFAPYGSVRYSDQVMPTDYSFAGQRLDQRSGLLYDNARYYDPVSGRFTRADTVQTNTTGMDPYAYVGDSPETKTDPTGNHPVCIEEGDCNDGSGGGGGGNSSGGNGGGGSGSSSSTQSDQTTNSSNGNSGWNPFVNAWMAVTKVVRTWQAEGQIDNVLSQDPALVSATCGGALSFRATTVVATSHGA